MPHLPALTFLPVSSAVSAPCARPGCSTIVGRFMVAGALLLMPIVRTATRLHAQTPATSPATRLIGTVKAISSSGLTVTKDDGSVVTLTLAEAVRVQQLPPGSTDIKAALPATTGDIAEGDRVLVAAHPGDAGVLSATRVVLMKSGDIAQTNATRQADWQKRGSGGLITAIDPAARSITIISGTKKTTVQTSDRTIFRRYAPGSVRFEDAKTGTLSDLAIGDQLRVRGSRDVDTGSIAADEVVTGAFRNVAGTVTSVDTAANTVTLKDLATKKNVTVAIGTGSDLRSLPPEISARFAARARGATTPSTAAGSTERPSNSGSPSAAVVGSNDASTRTRSGSGSASGDLSQLVPRLPKTAVSALKPGEAVLVVGSGLATPGAPITVITLLSGVEPLLAASPEGTSSFTLSPWSLGGGGEAATGATQ